MVNTLKLSKTVWTPEDKMLLAELIANKSEYIIRFIDNNKAGYTIVGSENASIGIEQNQITDFLKIIRPLSKAINSSQPFSEHTINLQDGWLDALKLKKTLDVRSSITGLIMADLHTVTGLKNIQICTNYLVLTNVDGSTGALSEPYYISTTGWEYSISACRDVKQLPQAAKTYIGIVQGILNKFVYLITVDKEPGGIISVKNPFLAYRPPLPS